MTFRKPLLTLFMCITLISLVTPLGATYYLDTLFPIGLTGLNNAGRPPFSSYGWKWAVEYPVDSLTEDTLIYDLGVNVIGCQDAHPTLLMDFNPDSSNVNYWTNCYLHKICKPLTDDGHPVYLITAGYYTTAKTMLCPGVTYTGPGTFDRGACGDITLDTNEVFFLDTTDVDEYKPGSVHTINPWKNQAPSTLFRSPYRNSSACSGIGSSEFGAPQLSAHRDGDAYNRHGRNISDGDNWSNFDGDSTWKDVVDEAIVNFDSFFIRHSYLSEYMWGWNLISEDPAISRNNIYELTPNNPWRGCWAAVDYVFTGHKGTSYFLGKFSKANSLGGIRGIENSNSAFTSGDFQGHRMFIAKGGTSTLHRGGYNIFEALPDLDASVVYSHGWCHPNWNYGQQDIFDWWLYGNPSKPQAKGGRHDIAIYFQQYGKTHLAYPEQKRRWIASISIEWELEQDDVTNPRARRPCPPEIRCAVYLSLSRGAKGILFHPWTNNYSDSPNMDPSQIQIPDPTPYTGNNYCYLGLRDKQGYPFGDVIHFDPISTHKLNSGTWSGGNTYWHQHNYDSTYAYLANALIPELKLIAPTLLQLDWVNGYSLNSTDPDWTSPCPHYYVEDVWGVEYADLGFFDHPYEPIGVEYFMLVNREGIADMTNRNVSVALDASHWPGTDSLTLTDIADREHPRALTREGNRYVFSEVFEPGEGKLYRVAPVNEAPVAQNINN